MTRRCSQCSSNGHNTRTCPIRAPALASSATSSSSSAPPPFSGVQIFGVKITDGPILKKSATMGNLASANSNPDSASSNNPNFSPPEEYLSDDPCNRAVCSSTVASLRASRDRKKGIPWSEEEHRKFLIGLQKLGKGDWRGISRNFVKSRTPTQVASHAQKHFMRQSNAPRRKRRSSLFDMVADANHHRAAEDEPEVTSSQEAFPLLKLSLAIEASSDFNYGNCSFVPGYGQVPASVPFSFWPTGTPVGDGYRHELVKPVAILPVKPINVDECRISYLCFGEREVAGKGLPPVSFNSGGDSSRQSAFRANVAV